MIKVFEAFNYWDIVLLLVVLGMAVPLAYMRQVSWKAFIMSLPFPGTVAMLSLGQPVNAANILGLYLLLLFANIVRFLYYRRILRIIPAIITAAVVYGVLGGILNRIYPMTTAGFIIAAAGNVLVAAGFLLFTSPKREPGQKSKMHPAAKILVVAAVITAFIVLKKILGSFMVAFPMVSMIAMYESRYSLWSMSRQMAIVMLTLGVFFTTIFILQEIIGFYWAIVCGWLVFLCIIFPLHRRNFPGRKACAVQRE